jgi:fibro-slime domain-containing protein
MRRTVFVLVVAILSPACDCGGGTLMTGRDGGGGRYDGASGRDGDVMVIDTGVAPECGDLVATVRDFRADHPDFEAYLGSLRGIVENDVGADGKPVYAHAGGTAVTTGPSEFDQWYRDVDGVNMAFEITLPVMETSPGVFVFDDSDFFPLDGRGWPGEEVLGHNFHFTTEIHATFLYRGGEVFTFRGDDDVFLFINGRLALDLGGVHGVEMGTVDFDAQAGDLGISPGGTYTLDIFHAERHTSESNFRLETSIDCFIII